MGNLRMNADQISYKGGEKPMSVEEAIKNAGNTGLAHTADIAPDFSTESAYSAGDYVYHNGTLYAFTSNHAAGAWSTSDTQAVTVGGELADVKSGLIKRVRITDTTSSAGTIATAIDFNRAVSAMCITGYNYYLNIRESSIGKAVVFAYEVEDGYQSLKPLLNTEITFDLLYVN